MPASNSIQEALFNDVLPFVTKPSRYLGTEVNSVHKEADAVEVRIGLAFPDLYDLGLGNLGLHILYAILNDLPWCWAERVYAPAPDMEAALRGRGLPLFTWESKTPLAQVDLVGFSLQSELTYTSVLNMLDLAGVPLRATARNDSHPLVFAGGPGAFNPEPMAAFVDFFVVGDGEEAILEIAECARGTRGMARADKLAEFAKLDGVYVPELYPVDAQPDGRIVPAEDAPKVVRRVVDSLDAARFPDDYIVPFTQLIHDRAGIEVMRGCTHGCRFCQAGMVTRPVRERDIEHLGGLMDRALQSTGYEEVSLVSLSTCDYSRVGALLERSATRARERRVAVSLPALRLDTFAVELADAVTGERRTGLTFAPEAGTPRLRAAINKQIAEDQLLDVTAEVFKRGWGHVKLYFMIGLPGETDEDVAAIADLCRRVVSHGREVSRKARVFTGISTFVPKPFTPFQWAAQIGLDEICRKHAMLKAGFKGEPHIKFGRHEAESSFIEGLIARGDRGTADLIEAAFRNGARLDSSSEHLDFQAWLDAIDATGFDVNRAFRERDLDERLPWDHIDALLSKEWLQREWQRAANLEPTENCRYGACTHCGVRGRTANLCAEMVRVAGEGAAAEKDRPFEAPRRRPEPAAVQRVRIRIGRFGEARFLSHLEMVSAWERILRRAEAPLSFSQGFHAHAKVTFAAAAPVGQESEGDYMDVVLNERVEPARLVERIRAVLPKGFCVYEGYEVALNAASLMSSVVAVDYTLHCEADLDVVEGRIAALLAAEALPVERKGRPSGRRKREGVRVVDIRPCIGALEARRREDGAVAVDLRSMSAGGHFAKPREIIALLELDPGTTRVLKRRTDFREG